MEIPLTIIRPKLLILGNARHGKDTVGEWFVQKGYTFVSSSRFVGETAVYPRILAKWAEYEEKLRAKNMWPISKDDERELIKGTGTPPRYGNFEAAFADRHNHRQFWFEAIRDYNIPDRSRLGRELFALYDMYVGLRNKHELWALKLHKAYDLAIWIDASERVAPEDSASISVDRWMADVTVDNNSTLEDLDKALLVLYDKWVRPLERTSKQNPFLPQALRGGQNLD